MQCQVEWVAGWQVIINSVFCQMISQKVLDLKLKFCNVDSGARFVLILGLDPIERTPDSDPVLDANCHRI